MGKMKTALMIVAIIGIIVIAGSMLYYFVFYRPGIAKADLKLQEQQLEFEKEKQKVEEWQEANKEQQELNKKVELAKALVELDIWYDDKVNQAYEDYLAYWDRECEALGLKPGSSLPQYNADRVDEDYDQNVERINKKYQSDKDAIFKLYE